MATLHGTVGEFDSSREDWSAYSERLEFYFEANGVDTPEKRRAVLLSVCGPETYRLIRSLVAPDKPSSRPFRELVTLVRDHFDPKPSPIVSRFKFSACTRNQGETVAAFVARLRQLTEHCEYGASLDEMLRDRLFGGINNEQLQRHLLAEPDLMFAKAFDMAQAYESAAKHSKDLQPSSVVAVHVVKDKPQKPASLTDSCYRCGGKHRPSDCRFKDVDCHYCGKTGHISRVCRSRLRGADKRARSAPRGGKSQREEDQTAHRLEHNAHEASQVQCTVPGEDQGARHLEDNAHEASSTQGADLDVYTLFSVRSGKIAPLIATVQVHGVDLPIEVDTGASLSLISAETYHTLWPTETAPTLVPSSVTLRTYSGEELKVARSLTVDVSYKGQECRLPLVVVAGSGPSLLGRD